MDTYELLRRAEHRLRTARAGEPIAAVADALGKPHTWGAVAAPGGADPVAVLARAAVRLAAREWRREADHLDAACVIFALAHVDGALDAGLRSLDPRWSRDLLAHQRRPREWLASLATTARYGTAEADRAALDVLSAAAAAPEAGRVLEALFAIRDDGPWEPDRLWRRTHPGLGVIRHDGPAAARIGIIGDVHAQDALLEQALDLVQERGCDLLVCVGDVIDGPGDLGRCIRLLRDHDVVTVRGNHERWALARRMRDLPHAQDVRTLPDDERAWLAALPAQLTFETARGPALLCHGLADDDMNRWHPGDPVAGNPAAEHLASFADLAYVLKGHTHHPGTGMLGKARVVDAGTLLPEHGTSVHHLDSESGLVTSWAYLDGRWVPADESAAPVRSTR